MRKHRRPIPIDLSGRTPDAGINGPKMPEEGGGGGGEERCATEQQKRSQLACHPHAETHTDKPLWPSEPIFPVTKA